MAIVCVLEIHDDGRIVLDTNAYPPNDQGFESGPQIVNLNPSFIQDIHEKSKGEIQMNGKVIGVFSGNPTCVLFGGQWYCW